MRVLQREIGNESALHRAPGRAILEIAGMRRDEETRAEESAFLVSESPGHIRWVGPHSVEINPIGQKDVIPRLARRGLRVRFVDLNSNLASVDVDFVQLPTPQKNAE